MSYTYLQDAGEESSAASFSDITLFAPLKSNPTPAPCSYSASGTACCHASPCGMTCEPLTASRGEGELMSSAGDSLVRTSPPQTGNSENPMDSKANGLDCGAKCVGSWARFDRASCSWKTAQCSLFGGLTEYSETWPRWGMMRAGECFPLPMLEHDTAANASGSWPTPTKWNQRGVIVDTYNRIKAGTKSRNSGAKIGSAMNWYPPAVENWTVDGKFVPTLLEKLMLWPIGWSGLRPLATAKFRQWQRWHGACSQTE